MIEPCKDRHECYSSNIIVDVWGSNLFSNRSSLERGAIEGESPVCVGKRCDPNEYRFPDRKWEDGSTKS